MTYKVGIIASRYFKVFGDRDHAGFVRHTIMALVLILSQAFISSTFVYVGRVLWIKCKLDVCTFVHARYFRDNMFYRVNVVEKRIDNPDQRITNDIQMYCRSFIQVISPIVVSPFTIGYYTYQAAIATGYIGPVSCLGFFVIFAIVNKLLMSPVVNHVFKREVCSGDFRFRHMQLRVCAESAAFYQAGSIENQITNSFLHRLIIAQNSFMARNFAVILCTRIADYLGKVLSYLAIGVPIFAGVYDSLSPSDLSALISKNAFVCIYLIKCFTDLIDIAKILSNMAGATHRVGELLEHMDELSANDPLTDGSGDRDEEKDVSRVLIHTHNRQPQSVKASALPNCIFEPTPAMIGDGEPGILLHSVTYAAPKSTSVLCTDLKLQICRGKNLLITGESGSGKSALLRVICGLWTPISGMVERRVSVGPRGMIFLPQIPYFIQGNLYEQISYPLATSPPTEESDALMKDYLKLVGMGHLLSRFGGLHGLASSTWSDQLSPGEIQRLSFVRLFYHRPQFAFLDEATSQISDESQLEMYRTCRDLDITVITVGHSQSLRRHHDLNLHICASSEWLLRPIFDDGLNSHSINCDLP